MLRSSVPVLLLLISGCASAGSAPPSWTLASGQSCQQYVPRPGALHAGEVLDVASTLEAIASDRFVRDAVGDSGLIRIAYDSAGARSEVSLHHRAATLDDALRITRAVGARASERGRARSTTYLLLVRSDPPLLSPLNIEHTCGPRWVNRPELGPALREFARDPRFTGRSAVIEMRVGVDGSVTEVRLKEGSGAGELDRGLMDVARSARFQPGLINGLPVATWATLPVRIDPAELRRW